VSMADAVAVAALPDGGAYVALEAGPNGQAEGSVRRLWPGGRMTTVLGCGTGCVPAAEGAEGRRVAVLPYGVAAMPGGGFVVATSAGLLRVGDDGLVHPVPGPAIWSPVALPGGEVLGTQTCSYALPACDPAPVAADSTRIVRLRADGTVVPIAGGGAASGDVPVATDAAIVPSSPTVAPDGRIVFLDTRIDAVRRVTPDGALVTVATVARPGKGTGDPGVALAAAPDGTFVFAAEGGRLDRISPDGTVTPLGGRLPDPLAAPDEWWRVAATGDGGLVLARYLSGDGVLRVVAVAPDGRRTIARRTVGEDWAPEAPLGLAGWPGRDVLVSFAGRLHRLAGDRLRVVDGDREPGFFGTTDGARLADVRLGWAEDLVPAGDGATYVVGDGRIRMLAAEGAAPPAVAITRESLRLAARRALVVRTTRPGRVTVEARDRRGRVVGRGRQEVEGGRVVVRLPRRLSGVVRATAVLRTAGGARAGDEQALLLGRALPVRAARQLAEDSPWAPPRASAADEDPIDERLVGGCRRLSRTRVDCRTEAADGTTWVGWTSRSCAILAIRLDRDGIVRLRGYGERAARRPDRRCGARERAPFAARPRWDAPRWWEAAPLRTP
ncbi:MAG: hypothetical protein HZB46_10790, partial [Solirubrobacterales bacterium]|nr:hypothetical protein [Solirubrobacterales bacterium]